MKLSEIKGERTIDVLADITAPIIEIASDENASKLFKREKCPEGMEPSAFMLQRIRDALPPLLKGHKSEIMSIMAALDGVTPEEYEENMTLASLVSDLFEMLTDEELLAFFQ